MRNLSSLSLLFILVMSFSGCVFRKSESKDEQISLETASAPGQPDSLQNGVNSNLSFRHLKTYPAEVILTGSPDHRLVPLYKKKGAKSSINSFSRSYYSSNAEYDETEEWHFMPGIDILQGYNLLNVAHYNLKTRRLDHFFNVPALIHTLYYPCFEQDSLNKVPINRHYYLVSAYDEDTNGDTLINRKDLRRFYHISEGNIVKVRLIPRNYSVWKSQYDPGNDIMYIYARFDENNNGRAESAEPVHVFWISLADPQVAKRML